MAVTETRAYPVSDTVLMRSALFALADMGATLQTYNEENGLIVATVSRWLGLQKQEVVVRIRPLEGSAQVEIDAPDVEKAIELLKLLATYARDGTRIQANATMQWVDLARQQANQARRRELTARAKGLLPGTTSSPATATETALVESSATDPDDPAQPVDVTASPVYIPDNPGVLVKNRQNMLIELKVDPAIFTDRTAHLVMCDACYATTLRGSAYCPNCGRPLTLEAVQPEMRSNAAKAAGNGLTFGLIAFAFSLVPLLILVLPAALAAQDGGGFFEVLRDNMTPLTIALSAALGMVPAVILGITALRHGQRASWYLNLPAITGQGGRGRIVAGNALAWLAIYLTLAWILLIIIALL